MSNENPYQSPKSAISSASNTTDRDRPGAILIAITVLAFLYNAILGFTNANPGKEGLHFALGGALGQAVILPAIFVLLFQFGEDFRNSRSRMKIFLWATIAAIILGLVSKATSQ